MKNLNLFVRLLISFIFVNVVASYSFAGPNRTTYQARIIKPDGYPLEAASVNFKFTILDPAGSCILFSETYSNVNMNSSGGMVSFALGSGVKSYPVSATTFEQVFSNITPTLSCDAGGPVSYSPLANDNRKIVMQFHDGSGWQTLPSMSINAVPYAMFANEAQKLNGKTDADFVQLSSLPVTCGVSEAIRFNGTSFSCLPVGGASVAVTSGSVTTALGYTPADDAGLTTVSNNVASVSSTVYAVTSTVTGLTTSVTALTTYATQLSVSMGAIVSSQWVTSGTTISYPQGSISVSGGVRISMDAVSCDANSAGTLRYNAGLVEYCNGTIWSAFGVAGAGITSLNGSASGSQTFGTGTTGTVFNITSVNGVHTFNIPLASAASVTAGLLSNADYTLFSNKMNATGAAVISALGYTPANSATVNGLANLSSTMASDIAAVSSALNTTNSNLVTTNSNISAVSSSVNTANTNIAAVSSSVNALSNTVTSLSNSTAASFAAISSSQWTTSGTAISYNTGHVGITSMTATSALTVPLIYGGTGISGNLRLESTTNSTKGYILMAQGSAGGHVGIGTTMPLAKLYVDSDGLSPNTPAAGAVAVFDNESSDMNITLATAPHRKASLYFANSGQPTRGSINYQFDNTPSLDKLSIMVNSASTVVLDAYNRMGIGVTSPNAILHITSGSTTVAPLKIVSGSLLAAPASGAIEYDGFNFYVTDGTNTRRALASVASPGTLDKTSVISSLADINLVPVGSVIVSSTTASTSKSTGALIVNGGLGVSGAVYASAFNAISAAGGASAIGVLETTGTGGRPYLLFKAEGENKGYVGYGVGSSDELLLMNYKAASTSIGNNGTRTMTLTASGNVGINTSSPNAKLDVSGSALFNRTSATNSGTISVGGSIRAHATATAANYGEMVSDDSSLFIRNHVIGPSWTGNIILQPNSSGLGSQGNVGIGLSNPSEQLTTTGNALIGYNGYPALYIRDTNWWMGVLKSTETSWPDADSFVFNTPVGRPFVFQAGAVSRTQGSPLMYIDASNGYVGIGTTTPSSLNGWNKVLDVSSNIHSKIVATVSSGTMNVENGAYAHGLETNAYAGYPVSHGGVGLLGTQTNHDVGIITNNTVRLHLSKTGDVGIATIAPLEKLDVNGSAVIRGANVYMVHDGATNANNDYFNYDDSTVNGVGGTYAFFADVTRGQSWTQASAALSAKAGYFNQHLAVNSTSASHTLTVNGSMNAAGQVVETMSFAIDGTASGTWAIGSLSNSAATTHVSFEMQVHNNSTIDALRFEVSLPTYSNGTFYSGWQELPVAFGSSAWNGAKNYVIDVLRSSAVSGNPFYFRVRNKGGNGSSSTMRLRMTYNNENTFTRITHVNTVGTAFNASTAAAGGPVDGLYGALEYSFPVATGQAWRPADNTGLFIKNSGYVGIGTSAPSVELEVSGTVKAQAYLYTSDRRLKEDIITLPDALEKALQLRGVNFVWKNSKEKTVGFIAQEVEAVYPELVKTDKATGYKAVQYGNIVAILVEALKEEHKQRVRSIANVEEKADARMNQLEKENQELKARLERLEKFISEKVK